MNSFSNFLCRVKPLSLFQNAPKIRQLYNTASIGLDDYIVARKKFEEKSDINKSRFCKKMQEVCRDDAPPTSLVFTEDLKQMVHIATDDPGDIKLVEKMMLRFNVQRANVRFGSFSFGPVIMRMFHYLNKPDEALNAYKNQDLNGLFDQLSSHVVLMDLLFKNEMYHDIIDVYKTAREKQLRFGSHPKSMMVLVFGAYYKLNTPKHCEEALKLYREMMEKGYVPLRRAIAYTAALALNQNDPHASIEVISSLPNQGHVHLRCIKALALCDLDKTEDALLLLKTVLQFDEPQNKQTFPSEVIERVKEAVEKTGSKQLITDCIRIYNQLKEQGHLIEKKLDDLLCSEVIVSSAPNRFQTTLNVAMDNSRINHRKAFRNHRHGLEEVV